ncbi:MAG: ArsR family transcriptional regulator [Methanomicrobiales archaeon]|nr:ArsR family transcriptional regulator [Methanomicrobiales archaeon]
MLEGDEVSHLLDILGNRNRRRIIQLLRQKPCFVTEISERLMISPKAVIEHLQLMERENILISRSDERRRKYYHLQRDFHVVIRLQQQGAATSGISGRDHRFAGALVSLRRMMEVRESLISRLDHLEDDIEATIEELATQGRDILRTDTEMNLVIALSGYDLSLNEMKEHTGAADDELIQSLMHLVKEGIVEQKNGRYRLCCE